MFKLWCSCRNPNLILTVLFQNEYKCVVEESLVVLINFKGFQWDHVIVLCWTFNTEHTWEVSHLFLRVFFRVIYFSVSFVSTYNSRRTLFHNNNILWLRFQELFGRDTFEHFRILISKDMLDYLIRIQNLDEASLAKYYLTVVLILGIWNSNSQIGTIHSLVRVAIIANEILQRETDIKSLHSYALFRYLDRLFVLTQEYWALVVE